MPGRLPNIQQVEEVFRSANVAHRQEMTLDLASVITCTCASPAHESAALNIIQVEILVHSTYHVLLRICLERWKHGWTQPSTQT